MTVMYRYLILLFATVLGIGTATVLTSNNTLDGVYNGTVLIYNGTYYLLQGREFNFSNVVVANGVVIAHGNGYAVATKLSCETKSGILNGLIVLKGDGYVVLGGQEIRVGDYVVINGTVLLMDACVYSLNR